ncbi:hypothetical protein BN873_1020008 [Candidatus Competibacter denitrificans Run_A_D11]|uniref:Uncharacterized protein n=1 Tax=Candidatus Competibacter denitrificans Run_A_D11 TaxID=1400863 RepID=W6M112_9GAMM|nr:hypothetical protein BN873_1020008 [Candidatus Competibacter denitrificans Run_A_D11]
MGAFVWTAGAVKPIPTPEHGNEKDEKAQPAAYLKTMTPKLSSKDHDCVMLLLFMLPTLLNPSSPSRLGLKSHGQNTWRHSEASGTRFVFQNRSPTLSDLQHVLGRPAHRPATAGP